MKNKLKVKEEWFCDFCGELITSAEDGMLEWDSIMMEDDKVTKNFRIVHHRAVKNCRPANADDHIADGHLDSFTGPNGLVRLLNIDSIYEVENPQELKEVIKRIHVDYYEEGRKYLKFAIEDGHSDIDPYGEGNLSQNDLEWLINKYA
ncbi:hypothetical protein ACTHQ4_02290 [Alkalicoccobacillus gibsonii]|uniref:hypothetical protein n=1 Tax=Alkalicoccobacillus gibsonii TaxID=79881 RepID=UPI003F7B8539